MKPALDQGMLLSIYRALNPAPVASPDVMSVEEMRRLGPRANMRDEVLAQQQQDARLKLERELQARKLQLGQSSLSQLYSGVAEPQPNDPLSMGVWK